MGDGEPVQWFKIQEKVFTRWVNDYLSDRELSITNLKTDLKNGLNLIYLLEVISGGKVGRYNRKPRMKFPMLENLEIALNFIKSEGIKLVNIGPEDIYSGNMRIILGLIWTLILRYEIKGGTGDDGESSNDLLEWVRSQIPEYDIKNFTKAWNDGKAVCALANSQSPGLVPDHWDKDPSNALDNAAEGIDKAEEWLGVDKLILPSEMVHPKVDKLAMMTYIAQYRNIAPEHIKKPKGAADCKAWGDGLKRGVAKDDSLFFVQMPEEIPEDKLKIRVEGPDDDAPCSVAKNADGAYDVKYTPTTPGLYHVHVTVGDEHIPGSVFEVRVYGAPDCRAWGDGLKRGVAGEESMFWVEMPPAIPVEHLKIRVEGPQDDAPCTVVKNDKGDYEVVYTPTTPGKYKVHVTVNDDHVPGSVFEFTVLGADDCRAWGPGLEKGIVDEESTFWVAMPAEIPREKLAIKVEGPAGVVPCAYDKDDKGDFEAKYTPKEAGDYHVHVTVNDQHVPGSVFDLTVKERAAARCKAWGPGLVEAVAEEDALFWVSMPDDVKNDPEAQLKIKIVGPDDEAPCTVTENEKGDYDCHYEPTTPGTYYVHVTVGDEHVPGSVFTVNVRAPLAHQCKAYGPGLVKGVATRPSNFKVEVPQEIQAEVDGKLKIVIDGPDGDVEPAVTKNADGDYDVVYTPTSPGTYDVTVVVTEQKDHHVPGSVFHPVVDPLEATRCRAFGQGLVEAQAEEQADFKINIKGPPLTEPLEVVVEGPEDIGVIPSPMTKNAKGNYDVRYLPHVEGLYFVTITVGPDHIRGSTFEVNCLPPEPRGRVRVYFTTTTGFAKVKGDIDRLENLFYIKKVHLRPDFEPWHAMDMMDKHERDAIYAEAGVRKLPIVFIDDVYVGGWDEIEELNEIGELDELLAMHTVKLLTPEEHMRKLLAMSMTEDGPNGVPRTHYCGVCGCVKLIDNRLCPDCGSEDPRLFTPEQFAKSLRFHQTLETKEDHATGKKWVRPAPPPYTMRNTSEERDDWFLALAQGDAQMVESMLIAGMDPNKADEDGNTPWRVAVEQSYDDIGAILLTHGAKFTKDDFFMAIYEGQTDQVAAMLEHGADIDDPDEEYITPLYVAISNQQGRIARMLRLKGAKQYVPGPRPIVDELFRRQCLLSNFDRIAELAATMADHELNGIDEQGDTVLDTAEKRNKAELVTLLKSLGCKNVKDLGDPPLHVPEGAATAATGLISSTNPRDAEQALADFFCAVDAGDLELVKLLVKRGMSVNVQDEEGTTPLDVCGDNEEMRQYLISVGAK